jgi:hypothetical protein
VHEEKPPAAKLAEELENHEEANPCRMLEVPVVYITYE